MNKNFKQLMKQSRAIALRDTDREQMRTHFVNLLGLDADSVKPRTFWHTILISHRHAGIAFGLVILLIAATTGVAAAAEGSIPGDTLYPIKIHVTEELRSALARKPESKAEWETKRVERRLSEAEKVITNTKKPNPQALKTIQANIVTHTQKIQQSIDEMERKGQVKAAAQASSDIEAPLNAHKQILRELKKSEKATDRLLKTVEDEERFVGSRRKNLEDQTDKKQDDNKQFSSTERTRREKHEEKVLLNISVPRGEDSTDIIKLEDVTSRRDRNNNR